MKSRKRQKQSARDQMYYETLKTFNASDEDFNSQPFNARVDLIPDTEFNSQYGHLRVALGKLNQQYNDAPTISFQQFKIVKGWSIRKLPNATITRIFWYHRVWNRIKAWFSQ